jgi:hypothetical protein
MSQCNLTFLDRHGVILCEFYVTTTDEIVLPKNAHHVQVKVTNEDDVTLTDSSGESSTDDDDEPKAKDNPGLEITVKRKRLNSSSD